MHRFEVELTDEQYARIRLLAKEGGDTPEEVVREAVASYLGPTDDEIRAKFSPEVMAHLDSLMDEVRAGGRTYTQEDVDAHLEEVKKKWRQSRAS